MVHSNAHSHTTNADKHSGMEALLYLETCYGTRKPPFSAIVVARHVEPVRIHKQTEIATLHSCFVLSEYCVSWAFGIFPKGSARLMCICSIADGRSVLCIQLIGEWR